MSKVVNGLDHSLSFHALVFIIKLNRLIIMMPVFPAMDLLEAL
jgi:hypothetical protein